MPRKEAWYPLPIPILDRYSGFLHISFTLATICFLTSGTLHSSAAAFDLRFRNSWSFQSRSIVFQTRLEYSSGISGYKQIILSHDSLAFLDCSFLRSGFVQCFLADSDAAFDLRFR